MLSITTDYRIDTGSPQPYLKRIADAGFSHVHWCHEWNTDHFYTRGDIDNIARWLPEMRLEVLDLHASVGPENDWGSPDESRRLGGVALVKNRIEMTARLAADVIIMHIPPADRLPAALRSLDDLEPFARKHGVRIAIENGHNWAEIEQVLSRFPPDYVGLCYDSGHGNLEPASLDWLDKLKDRLISIHMHDNDGKKDLHRLVFSGTVEWPRLVRILPRSSYRKCLSMEVSMRNHAIHNEPEFLGQAFETGNRLADMVAHAGAHNPASASNA